MEQYKPPFRNIPTSQEGGSQMRSDLSIKGDGRNRVTIGFGGGLEATFGRDSSGRVVEVAVVDTFKNSLEGPTPEQRIGRARLQKAKLEAGKYFTSLPAPEPEESVASSTEPEKAWVPGAHVDLFNRWLGKTYGENAHTFSNKVLIGHASNFIRTIPDSPYFSYTEEDLVRELRSVRAQKAAATKKKNKEKAQDPKRQLQARKKAWEKQEKDRQIDLF